MFEFATLCPLGSPDAAVPIAGSRAGALGVLNLELASDLEAGLDELRRLCEHGGERCGVLVDGEESLAAVMAALPEGLDTVLLAGASTSEIGGTVERLHGRGLRAYVVATEPDQGLAAEEAGADAVIAKGHEAAGWIGEEGAFVLSQRLLARLRTPVLVHGGIGMQTVAAARVAGAAGVVLDSQLLLARESPAGDDFRAAVARLDGSETAVIGGDVGGPYRVFSRPGMAGVERLRAAERELTATADAGAAWPTAVKLHAGGDGTPGAGGADVLPLGQDAAFAPTLAERFGTVAGIVDGLRAAMESSCDALRQANPLAEGGELARSHGTRYPIVQGPMTRVSDRAEFAAAVAEGGALPFLALALMRAREASALLARTAELIGNRPWGVGVLGFVPPELRAEQLEVIRGCRPPFALIAGGRPDQARELEEEGIVTYLHVPSPGLLRLFLADGARHFVFEGRECGGHVGPRTSFVLWDTMLRVLLEELPQDASDCHVLLAGGIHDARSASMAAATAAAASERGVRIGALMGTAYLFTREATECGAITPRFQEAAVAAADTVLLESGPGHATRCLRSPFVDQFEAERRGLVAEGLDAEEVRGRLEQLNIGRLRIAAKGVDRASNPGACNADDSGGAEQSGGADHEAPAPEQPAPAKLVEVGDAGQWERGMFMIGQVAALRDAVTTVADLHQEISGGSTEVLQALAAPEQARRRGQAPPPAEVAIVGLGCILPQAPDVETFWANILDEVDAITEVPAHRWDWERMYDADPAARDKVYSRWGGFVDPVRLDPMGLGLPPAALRSIEPFQLLALLSAQAALADAGYATRPFDRERAGVILGAGGGGADMAVAYTVRSALPSLLGDSHADLQDQLFEHLPEWTEDSFAGLLMNVAAGRIANRLDFGGPNFTVDAACASSLSAISLATRELEHGTADMVLAGGVDAIQNPFAYLCFAKTRALSPTGRCRPFDAAADGIAISEGFATVVLKRLADAERDGDRIYAVIRGVGAASDGRDRSLTAPRPEGQVRALRRAYAQAGFSPDTVGLVEAHGTGTVAGDGAEVEALGTVFGEHSEQRQWCAIGSVKSMIGHTKATAGVAGTVKAALALHHRVLPPTIGVSEPNPKVGFPDSPFYVNSEARPWLASDAGHPRRAAVSAFGFGGTDFHVVLEEYTGTDLGRPEAAVTRWPGELLVWRGSRQQIAARLDRLEAELDATPQPHLDALAQRLARELRDPERGQPTLALVVESLEDLRAKLPRVRQLLAGNEQRVHEQDGIHWSERPLAAAGKIAFLFPGQGSQTVNMGRELLIAFPEARQRVEFADSVLSDRYPQPLSRYIYPPPAFKPEEQRRDQEALTDTHVAQAALGAVELAYLRVLEELGVQPEMTAGHSYGEFMALAAAGALDARALLEVSEARGRYMKEAAATDAGAMAAVAAPPEALTSLLEGGGVVAANLNSPRQTVISGPREHVEAAWEWCRERHIGVRMLPVACAFHSPHVAGAQQRLAEQLGRMKLRAPQIPVYSNTTGQAHGRQAKKITGLLSEHLIRPVNFVREVEAMHDDGARLFVEVGPGAVLAGLVPQILGEREHMAVSVNRAGRSGLLGLLNCLGVLAAEGVPIQTDYLFRGRPITGSEARKNGRGSGGPDHSWLVDGGAAWPASGERPPVAPAPAPETVPEAGLVSSAAPVSSATPISTPHPQEPSVVINTRMNGGGAPAPAAKPEAVEPTGGLHDRPPPGALLGVQPGADRAAEVMLRHQQVMQQFLETQRSVMLGYLGAARSAPAAGPPLAVPRPALPAARPAPQPGSGGVVPSETPPAVAAGAQSAPAAQSVAPADAVDAQSADSATTPAPVNGSPDGSADGRGAVTRERIEEQLLAIVSERTGYPTDMLGLDADLEGDLGIDSIKRVEIAGNLTQSLALGDAAEVDLEALTASRTLRAVIDLLAAAVAATGDGEAAGAAAIATTVVATEREQSEEKAPFDHGPAEQERIGRFVVQAVGAPDIAATAGLASTGVVVIVDDGAGVGEELAEALAQTGDAAVRVAPGDRPRDAQEAAKFAAQLLGRGGAKALVHLAGLGEPGSEDGGSRSEYGALPALLLLVQALHADLEAAAAAGGAAVLGATRLGGAFGVDGRAPDGAAPHGALHGFLKTLAHEWPAVRVKAVDVSPESPRQTADRLLEELTAGDGLVEVGYREGERIQLGLAPAPLAEREEGKPLDEECVVLVTGGARGITAQVALRLAERHRPKLVLVGRTPEEEESPETAALTDLADLRRAMIEARRRDGAPLTPVLVERDCQRILRGREVRESLQRLRATGATVEYLACDVSDQAAFAELIGSLYERDGRIDGVIHGAGVIEDGLVAEKQLDSLQRVLATKAGAAQTLAANLQPESLRFLALFSSVSGRFGNRGQADYAAANEVLGRLAAELDRRWPARVVSIGWGPWRGAGMVSPALEQEFARRGVALIGVERGCELLEQELTRGRKGEAELVVGAPVGLAEAEPAGEVLAGSLGDGAARPAAERADAPGPAAAPIPAAGPTAAVRLTAVVPVPAVLSELPLFAGSSAGSAEHPDGAAAAEAWPVAAGDGAAADDGADMPYVFDLAHHRCLDDHRIDGRPVLPFALAMELMAEVATACSPGLEVAGLREIRLLDGVVLHEDRPAPVVLQTRPAGGDGEVEVTIRPRDGGRAHYRARVELHDGLGAADGQRGKARARFTRGEQPPALSDLKPFPMAIEEAYRDLLFHGPMFQGIVGIEGLDERGATTLLQPSDPARCLNGAEGTSWLLDPVLLDSALQVQVLWARLQWDVTLLPAEIGGYTRLAVLTEDGPVRHELRIRPASNPPLCHADHWFFAPDGRLVAQLQDVVGVGTKALNRLAGVKA